MSQDEILSACTAFEWDEGNLVKNWEKHRVSASEYEQIFFNRPLVTAADPGHSGQETRYYALGHTDSGRLLFVVFTVRERRIRVISARGMNRKERRVYEAS
jgi:uncharacterized DUF497 family protein